MLPLHLTIAIATGAFAFFSAPQPSNNSLKGEYREIRVAQEMDAIKAFTTGSEEAKSRWATRIEAAPSDYAPAVFFHLAIYQYEQEQVDEALAWLYRGRIRTYYDVLRCTDRSAAGAGDMLNGLLPARLRLEQFIDLEKSKRIMEQAIQWDRETPHNYDPRWIALHGIRASLPEPAPGYEEALTIPDEQWESLAEEHRSAYLTQWLQDVADLTDEQLDQIQVKYDQLSDAEQGGQSDQDLDSTADEDWDTEEQDDVEEAEEDDETAAEAESDDSSWGEAEADDEEAEDDEAEDDEAEDDAEDDAEGDDADDADDDADSWDE